MIYFTGDLHLGHKNIIDLCNRPFSSLEEMDEVLIENYNKKVKNRDTVYIVGDLIWEKADVEKYLSRLNGNKILICGNHDAKWIKRLNCSEIFKEITLYKEEILNSRWVTLCHYPMLEWKNSRKVGSSKMGYLIHGHVHNRMSNDYTVLFGKENALNAGVDVNGFAPVNFDELVENNEIFKRKFLSE